MLLEKMTAVALAIVPAGILTFGAATNSAREPVRKGSPRSPPDGEVKSGCGRRERGACRGLARPIARSRAPPRAAQEGRSPVTRTTAPLRGGADHRSTASSTPSPNSARPRRQSPRTARTVDAQLRSIELAEGVLMRERAELAVGKGTIADVAEAEQRLEQFNLGLVDLGVPERRPPCSTETRSSDTARRVITRRGGSPSIASSTPSFSSARPRKGWPRPRTSGSPGREAEHPAGR